MNEAKLITIFKMHFETNISRWLPMIKIQGPNVIMKKEPSSVCKNKASLIQSSSKLNIITLLLISYWLLVHWCFLWQLKFIQQCIMGMRNIAKFVPLFLLLRKFFSIDCIDINQKPGNSKKKNNKKTPKQNCGLWCG